MRSQLTTAASSDACCRCYYARKIQLLETTRFTCAPREGSDAVHGNELQYRKISIHASRDESDRQGLHQADAVLILIHAPHEGNDSDTLEMIE